METNWNEKELFIKSMHHHIKYLELSIRQSNEIILSEQKSIELESQRIESAKKVLQDFIDSQI